MYLAKEEQKIKSILIAVDGEVLVQNLEDLLEATLMCLAFYFVFNLAFTKDNRPIYNSILGLLLLPMEDLSVQLMSKLKQIEPKLIVTKAQKKSKK